ncbi:ABC-type branched-subunit amino acid transport system substrate-binding protein [Chitinivorax tropicus]|uniref:ABC-type branched-subunit amino acid transport system substrate-binding protein n=1 Tax=Chitinivorax tropicus TaxID=714531 RepID=A0A840MP67_9PROT|nr:ABC transporter substrate-binding protein [Chitinivorax tropicus]MBB5017041.1 ABC-type branched-subunit amino acid transport system substrate-binding protein [Chitinivorax tropicus]
MTMLLRLLAALLVTMLTVPSWAEPTSITIVQVLDLSGPNGDTGKDYMTGAKVYFDSINAKGGVDGRRIQHVFRDDQGNPALTTQLTNQLIDDYQPAALFGYLGNDGVTAMLNTPRINRSGIPLVAPYTGLNVSSDTTRIFHIRAGLEDETRKIIRMAINNGLEKLAVFHGNDSLGRAGMKAIEQALASEKKPLLAHVAYTGQQINQSVKEIWQAKPQAVILAAPTIATANFVREYRKVSPGTMFFALSSINHQTLQEFLGTPQAAQGIAVTTVIPSPSNPTTAIAREHIKAMKIYRDEAPSYATLEGFIAAKYLVEALRKAGSQDPQQVAKALTTTRHLDLGGYLLDFSSDAKRGSRYVDLAVFSRSGVLTN